MEVKEIIKKKKELSSKITELVNRFCNETEVSVENIRVTRVDVRYETGMTCANKHCIEIDLANPFEVRDGSQII